MKYSKIKNGLKNPQTATKQIYWSIFGGKLVNLMEKFIKNDDKTIVLGSRYGTAYDGNSRVMYEWLLDHEPEINPVWMTQDDEIYTQLSNENKPVSYINSSKGARLLSRASVGGITHNHRDITPSKDAIPNTLQIIHLRNAAGIMWDREYMKKSGKMTKAKWYRNRWDTIVANSEWEVELERSRVPCDINTYRVTGFPRNDLILEPPNVDSAAIDLCFENYDHVFLYAPSKRKPLAINAKFNNLVDFFPFDDFAPNQLTSLLKNNNTLILLRPHPTTTQRINSEYSDQYRELEQSLNRLCEIEGIQMADHERYPSVGHLLKNVDGLITDYSGILLDFLLTESPVMFIPYDYETWNEQLGFVIEDYYSLPGPMISNFEEFYIEMEKITHGNDAFKKQREKFANKYYEYRDGNARKRIFEIMKEMIHEQQK